MIGWTAEREQLLKGELDAVTVWACHDMEFPVKFIVAIANLPGIVPKA